MVVAKVVRIRNTTLRTFSICAGDSYYTPQVDGRPSANGIIDVPPGFDQEASGLMIPWENLSGSSLLISEEDTGEKIRCIVAPLQEGSDDRDWLQFRSDSWDKVGDDFWIPVGQRHFFYTVGGSADLELTFRDARSYPFEGQADLMDIMHFDHALFNATRNTVFLNIFDLVASLSVPNSILCNTVYSTMGAFHAAVQVYGEEWSFYRTPNPLSCGVCKSLRPRHHPVHVYRQSVNLGQTSLKEWEVRFLIRGQLATKWPGGSYDLLNRNCIHFCEELQLCLGVKPVPSWVRGLHETGASIFHCWPVCWPFGLVFGRGGQDEKNKFAIDNGEIPDERTENRSSWETPRPIPSHREILYSAR